MYCSPGNGEQDSLILSELRRLRQEHTEVVNDSKKALARLETNMKELGERTASLEQQTVNMEERLGDTEDRKDQLPFYFTKLSAKCDMQSQKALRKTTS